MGTDRITTGDARGRHDTTKWLTAFLLSGGLIACIAPERVCVEGEDPVLLLVDGELTGGDCVPHGEMPAPDFVRYPADLEPTYLRDTEDAKKALQGRIDRGKWQP